MIRTRDGKIIFTNEKQNRILKGLYGTVGGRAVLKLLTAPAVSRAVGGFMDSPLSRPLINPFIKANNIDISQYITDEVSSYNDFFTRKIKNGMRPVDMNPEHFISPCDSKLSAYRICEKSIFQIKGAPYRIADLLQNESLARRYGGGCCLIFRLEVDDYHRYCYIDNGSKGKNTFIPGELHTVNPVALGHYNIYKRNYREYTVLQTESFGDVVQIEVGAMMVGRIENHHQEHSFTRGEEKGMFMFGGSTIVLLVERDKVSIDGDILKNTAEGYETVVKYGERIGCHAK